MDTPIRDLVIIVTARNASAGHQKQDLRHGIHHFDRGARVLHISKVLEEKAKAVLGNICSMDIGRRLVILQLLKHARLRDTKKIRIQDVNLGSLPWARRAGD